MARSSFACLASIGLVAALLIGTAHAPARAAEPAKKSAFTPAQQEELKQFIRAYLVANPEVLKEAAIALQAKEEAARDAKQKTALDTRQHEITDSPEGTVMGNPRGNVTIVEFFDYNCGYCKKFFPTLMETVKADGNIRLVMKEFPILAQSSVTAAKTAIAAAKQGKYAEFHTVLISNRGALTDDVIDRAAKTVGLDMERLAADMKSPEIEKAIVRNASLAEALDITGTPALIVGKTIVHGAVDKNKVKELIAATRGKS
jgi:protein-disulfide isomerase